MRFNEKIKVILLCYLHNVVLDVFTVIDSVEHKSMFMFYAALIFAYGVNRPTSNQM